MTRVGFGGGGRWTRQNARPISRKCARPLIVIRNPTRYQSYAGRVAPVHCAGFWAIEEADILFNNYYRRNGLFTYKQPTCYGPLSTDSFRSIALHEIGHGLGLSHNSKVSKMTMMQPGRNTNSYSRPLYGLYCAFRSVFPHPDDAAGGRYLYPSGNTSYEVAVGPHYVDLQPPGVGAANIEVDPGYACPGDTIRTRISWANRGNGGNSGIVELRLSSNKYISSLDQTVFQRTWTFSGYKSKRVSFTLPDNVEHRTYYYLGSRIGTLYNNQSWWWTNNTARYLKKIWVESESWCG